MAIRRRVTFLKVNVEVAHDNNMLPGGDKFFCGFIKISLETFR